MIILLQLFGCTIRIIKSCFNITGMWFYFFKMRIYIFIWHSNTNESYPPKILLFKVISPIKRYITALNNKVLFILNSSLYYLSDDWPKIVCKLIIVFWGEISNAATNKSHFQMVNWKIREFVFLKHPLCQNRFPDMGCSRYNYYHLNLRKSRFVDYSLNTISQKTCDLQSVLKRRLAWCRRQWRLMMYLPGYIISEAASYAKRTSFARQGKHYWKKARESVLFSGGHWGTRTLGFLHVKQILYRLS